MFLVGDLFVMISEVVVVVVVVVCGGRCFLRAVFRKMSDFVTGPT